MACRCRFVIINAGTISKFSINELEELVDVLDVDVVLVLDVEVVLDEDGSSD
jgi:hypothetical protein